MHATRWHIGCAGWAVPAAHAAEFPASGSQLERYSVRFRAVELNSSFYRPHRPTTYARWAAMVPEDFRFAVKAPKQITHTQRLRDAGVLLERFLEEVCGLGPKLGPLLVQLPPSLAFDARTVDTFFELLRTLFAGDIVCEPRHRSWFSAEADQLLAARQVARVAADPAVVPRASVPGGWPGVVYYRLHGFPRMYYSAYDPAYLEHLAQTLACVGPDASVWCIFDNTADGAATQDGLLLQQLLATESTMARQLQTLGARSGNEHHDRST